MLAWRLVTAFALAGLAVSSAACAQTPEQKKAQARSGSEWTVHLSDGETMRYTLKPGEGEPGVTVFADKKGREMKILVADDSTVLFIPAEGGCYRTGKLVNGKVVNGISGDSCTPGGSWTAEMR